MKLILERDVFSAAISAAHRSAGRDDALPLLKNILLMPNGKSLGIAATNLSMRADIKIPVEISGEGVSVAIDGTALDQIISRLPQGAQVQMEWVDDRFAAIHCAGARYRLPSLPATDFPDFTKLKEPVSFIMQASELARALQTVRFAVSNDTSRLYLCGVWMERANNPHAAFGTNDKPMLTFVGTTLREFSRVAIFAPVGTESIPPVIVPKAAVDEIIRQCANIESDAEVSVAPNLIRVVTRGTTFVSKLIEGTIPDYYRSIPDNVLIAKFDIEQLTRALTRMRGIGDITRGSMMVRAGETIITARHEGGGEAEERIEIEYEGPELDLRVNVKSLLAVVEALDGELGVLRLNAERSKPILLNTFTKDGAIDFNRTFLTMQMEA